MPHLFTPDFISLDIIPTHKVAATLLDFIDNILDKIGLERHRTLEEFIYVSLIAVISLFLGWAIKRGILALVRKMVKLRNGEIGRELLAQHLFQKCSHIIPPLVFLALLPFAFTSNNKFLDIAERIVGAYALITFGMGLCAVMGFIFMRFNKKENTKGLPIKGILNIAQGIVWIIIAIISVSVLIDKSPAVLLGALGAFAAALMLIFKDSILGFVAGIQMSQNDMLRVGDWIVVPNTPANGIVLDVSLSRVKIQNFDNTIVNVPPYTLVSTSFRNYRGMSESGARQIDQMILFDSSTVKACTPELIDRVVAKYPIMKDFVAKARKDALGDIDDPGLRPINGTIATNLGLYRGYLSELIYNSPKFATNQQLLINVVNQTDLGITVQIYCFTSTTDWDKYEAIMSDLMEHVAVSVQDFDLALYTSGSLTVTTTSPTGQTVTAPAPNLTGNSKS